VIDEVHMRNFHVERIEVDWLPKELRTSQPTIIGRFSIHTTNRALAARAWNATPMRATCNSVVRTTAPKTTQNTQPNGVSNHMGVITRRSEDSQD
jgi:hypothetical protein